MSTGVVQATGARPGTRPEPAALVRVGVPVAILVGAMLLLPISDVRGGRSGILVFGASGPVPGVLDLVCGQALLLAGVMGWVLGLRARVGTLAILAGVAWFGPDLFALERAAPLVRAAGRFLLAPLLLPLLLHLALAALGRDGGRRVRLGIAAMYLVALAIAGWNLTSYDAQLDFYCLTCDWQNPLLIDSHFLVIRAGRMAGAMLALAVATSAGLLVARRVRATPRPSASGAAVLVGCAALALAAGVRGVLMLAAPREDPTTPWWIASWLLVAAAAITLALGVGGSAVETWRRATRMRRIGDSLEAAPEPGTLQGALRRALGDPDLRVAYRLDDGTTVDPDGAVIDPRPAPGRDATPVERDGIQLALVLHAGGVERATLADAFGPAVLVALDNERLRAARLAQLEELRASRARIVAVGDAELRRLERDLHDGVQQQLLSVLFDVRLARLAAERAPDAGRAAWLVGAEALAQDAVDELRRIAHGIHPAVLSRSGLGAALASLAEEAPLPMELAADGIGRLPEGVEAAAYQVVAEVVGAATAAGASAVDVTASVSSGTLRVELRHDGVALAEIPVAIADRIGATGGEATVEALASGGTLLRVELPCA